MTDIDADKVNEVLIREWHEDQCNCTPMRIVDGDMIADCLTQKDSKYSYQPPISWTVEAVLDAIKQIESNHG